MFAELRRWVRLHTRFRFGLQPRPPLCAGSDGVDEHQYQEGQKQHRAHDQARQRRRRHCRKPGPRGECNPDNAKARADQNQHEPNDDDRGAAQCRYRRGDNNMPRTKPAPSAIPIDAAGRALTCSLT